MKCGLCLSIIGFIFVTLSSYTIANTSFWQQIKAVFQPEKQHQGQNHRIKIVLWHSFGGSLGQMLRKIIKQFNDSQSQYVVISVNKSDYNNTLTSAATAYRSGTQPNILLSYDIATAMMIHSGGAILPLSKLMAMTKVKIKVNDFWPAIRGYYSVDGKLAGFPFSSSSPVLFYNKTILDKAGVKQPPETWQQIDQVARKLRKAGQQCIFTSGYPSWVLLEEFSMWNNIPFASDNNGFDSLRPKLLLNNKKLIAFLNQLQQWSYQGIFMYGGRVGASDTLFTSGKCAMTMQSSSDTPEFTKLSSFRVAVAKMPFWAADGEKSPQNTIIGGGAFWTVTLPKDIKNPLIIYKGVALFYKFLSKANIQAEWSMGTGYIPATRSAFNLMTKRGFYQKNPYAKVSLDSLNHAPPKPYTKGIRLGNFPLIRQNNNAMIESIVSGNTNVKEALNKAIASNNLLINQFYQQNK